VSIVPPSQIGLRRPRSDLRPLKASGFILSHQCPDSPTAP
jgi:hypothetical protein